MSMDFNTVKLWEASGGNVLAVRNSQGILWEPSSYTKSGVSPLSYIGNDVPLIELLISGNMQQSGTPTSTTPIQPQECGERTGNLANLYGVDTTFLGLHYTVGENMSIVINGTKGNGANVHSLVYPNITLPAGTYTVKVKMVSGSVTDLTANDGLFFGINQSTYGQRTTPGVKQVGDVGKRTFTLANDTLLSSIDIAPSYGSQGSVWANATFECWFYAGSDDKPFEPYGYKLDISSGNTTTPVYLGEVETTRRVKKLVLTGEETFGYANNCFTMTFDGKPASVQPLKTIIICNTYNGREPVYRDQLLNYQCCITRNYNQLAIRDNNYSEVADFKAYLAAQYAAGTPVTVWYILATEQTGILNEPLRKIGNYADTLSVPKSTVPIPTVLGNNVLTVDTSLPPSSVSVTVGETQWERFRRIVRAGLGPIFYPVGTKLFKVWRDTTSEALIVGGYDVYFDETLTAQGYTHSVLLMEEKLTPSLQADAVEAMMYVETAMPPGTYKFTIPDYDSSYGGNKTYYFETTQTVPVGGQICLEWRYQAVPRTIRTYASSTSTTVLDSYGTSANPLPEWIDGTSPAAVDLGTASVSTSVTTGSYGTFNHIHRARYGSNNYYQSKLRQYINADVASNWWTPMTIFDRPMDFYSYGPNPASASGYLYSQPADFASVLATPTVPCYTNSTFEYGNGPDGTAFTRNTAYNVKDKLFLLSHTEVNLTSGTPAVGSVLPYYTGAADAKRIKYRKDNNSAAPWWFRVPFPSVGNYFRSCPSSGALDNNSAYGAFGLAAACVIQ